MLLGTVGQEHMDRRLLDPPVRKNRWLTTQTVRHSLSLAFAFSLAPDVAGKGNHTNQTPIDMRDSVWFCF